jgi:hypothetical protein
MTRAASKWRQRLGMHVLFPSSTLENPNTYYIGWHFVHLFTAEKPRLSLKVPVFFCCTRNVADQLKSQFVPGQTGGLQAGHVLASVLLRIAGKPLATPLAGQTLRSCRQSDLQRFKALGPRRIEDWLRIRRCPDIALPILHCPHVPCTI